MLRYRDKLTITLLIAGCLFIVFWRLSIVDAEKKALLPERHYQFMVNMELEGHKKNVSVRMTLPLEIDGQSVRAAATVPGWSPPSGMCHHLLEYFGGK